MDRQINKQGDVQTDIEKQPHRETQEYQNRDAWTSTLCFCLSPRLSTPQLRVHPSLVRAVAGGRDGLYRGPTGPGGIGVAHPGLHPT